MKTQTLGPMAQQQSTGGMDIGGIGDSIWVSASAGSGKTTILMRRLLSLILSGVDVSKIVCITYTRTGAQEIKERTYSSLSRLAIVAEDEFLREIVEMTGIERPTLGLLRRARNLFAESIDHIDDLRIFTIHSFCQQLISRFPSEARVPYGFEIIDEYQSSNLVRESVENILQSADQSDSVHRYARLLVFEKNEEDFYDFVDYLVSKRKKFEFLGKFDYRQDLQEIFNLESTDEEEIISSFLNHDCSNILTLYGELNDFDPSPRRREGLKIVRNFLGGGGGDSSSREAYIDLFLTKERRKRSLKTIFTKKFTNTHETAMETFTGEQERCYNFVQNLENTRSYSLTVAMVEFAREVIGNYGKLKRNRGFLDFDDLIVVALELLKNTEYSTWINYKLDGEIEHVLLDEAQDTSTLQWEIIGGLVSEFFSGESGSDKPRSIFIVGDEKQSIFRFQDANPKMFSEKYDFYRNLIESSGNHLQRLSLQYSFRSVSTILEFVDEVFRDPDRTRKISALDSNIRHYSTRGGVGLVELWPLIRTESIAREAWKINFDNDEEARKQEILARLIAEKVASLLKSDRVIVNREGKSRRIGCGDIMILVRSRNHVFLSYLIRNLNGHGIPNSGLDRLNLLEHILIEDFISLFTFILFQNDDMSLANIIKSPFLAMTEEDLFVLCRYRTEHNISLFEALKCVREEKYRLLELLIDKSHSLGPLELCFYILEDCGFREKILSRFSPDTNDILNKFLLLVQQYENNSNPSLLDFLYFVKNGKSEIKKDLESGDTSQVRIMTIHASKGLQAPIVFIADANSVVDQSREKILWVGDSAHEIPVYMADGSSDILEAIRRRNGVELYSEYLRLFYVALTRAENELYICGLVGRSSSNENGDEIRNTWYDISRTALTNLMAREMDFETGITAGSEYGKKLVYGRALVSEEQIVTGGSDDADRIGRIEEIVGNIRKYEPREETKKIISPSQFFSSGDRNAFHGRGHIPILKGKAVHGLLEILPKVDPSHWHRISETYIDSAFSDLSVTDREEVREIVPSLLKNENFREFFQGNSRAEVSILGEVDGLKISGKIDRMIEFDDRVVLLDYKNTSRMFKGVDDLPEEYVKQLELYRKLVKKLNPSKTIECYILTTVHGDLFKVF